MPVTPSPEQIRESKLAEGPDEIPFSAIDVDDVITLANREKPEEWHRFKVTGIRHARDTSKPGDPEMWMISGPNSSQFTLSMFPGDIYKVVDKRG